MRAAILCAALVFSVPALAEHICEDWLDNLGPCTNAKHTDCNVATYKCKGPAGNSGCGRTYTIHVPDIDKWTIKRKR